jgi:hypothetical protein
MTDRATSPEARATAPAVSTDSATPSPELTHPVDVASVRSQIGEMTAEIRELRARETDIVYDAYAFDLGTGD